LHKLLDPFSAIDDRPVKAATLIVGLGSAHGDDQIGWRVAERLAAIADRNDNLAELGAPAAGDKRELLGDLPPRTAAVSVRIARSPSELLDWLDGVDRLIVCDTCQNVGAPGTTFRLCWPNARLATLRSSGSHDIGLAEMLALAEQLYRLPKEVIIWCAQGEATTAGSSLSASGHVAVTCLVEKISQELGVPIRAAG
jgi:hydrogenase maturation protease